METTVLAPLPSSQGNANGLARQLTSSAINDITESEEGMALAQLQTYRGIRANENDA
jgi:hypothetical protein